MRRVVLCALFIVVFAAGSARLTETGASNIDFDQGVDASKALEHAREQAGLSKSSRELIPSAKIAEAPPELARLGIPRDLQEEFSTSLEGPHGRACLQIPPEQDEGSGALSCTRVEAPKTCTGRLTVYDLLPKDIREMKLSEKGSVTGPYEPLPRDSQLYAQAKMYPPRLQSLPPPVRDPLLEDWRQIDATRLELISQAQPLDTKDGQLYDQGVRLNAWRKRIDARNAISEQEKSEYYASCPDPAPDTPYCVEWRRVFNACIVRGNESIKKYNTAMGIWRQDRQTLQGIGNTFRVKVKDWEALKIEPFIEKAKGALEGSCDAVKSVRITPPNPPALMTGGDTLTMQGFPGYDRDNPCPIKSWGWNKSNSLGDIGTLTPLSEPSMAKLVTGPQEAVGAVILKVTDSMNNVAEASVVVSVKAPIRTCELNKLASHPHVRDICKYICLNSEPSGPLSVYGMPDIANPGEMICRSFILDPDIR